MSYKEYGIYRRIGSGCPFCVNTFKSLEDAKRFLYNQHIESDKKRNRLYYVDNDFFDNIYPNFNGANDFMYYKIVVREISEWFNIDDFVKNEKNNNIVKNKKIINFIDFA